MLAGAAMARKGIIVAASGIAQFESGAISVAKYGLIPDRPLSASGTIIHSPLNVRRDISQSWLAVAEMARKGQIIGVAAAMLLRDGSAERIAIGSLSGVGSIINAMFESSAGVRPFVERRKKADRRQA